MTPRQRIFEAARELFDAEGLEGLSMRKVASAVGLTPMALYRHFADKDALVGALTEHGLETWDQRLAAVQATAAGPFEAIRLGMDAYIDFALEEPRRFEAAFLLPSRTARKFPEDFVARRSPPVNRLIDQVEHARAQGLIGEASTLDVLMTVWALAQGLVGLYRAGRFSSEASFREFSDRAVARCLRSFAPPPSA